MDIVITRKLAFKDVFTFGKIIKEANLKSKISDIFSEISADGNTAGNAQKQAGIKLISAILESCGETEVDKYVYKFLSDITNASAEQIQNCDIGEILTIFKDLADKNDLKSFFTSATNLTV